MAQHIGAAHMAVPLMARLDADMLMKAHNLRVILQYGVGVEGVDIPAVRSPPFITPLEFILERGLHLSATSGCTALGSMYLVIQARYVEL